MSYKIFEKLCKARSVTPGAVAKATGIARTTFTAWKKGEYTPKTDKLQKIADYFEVSLEFLMTGTVTDGYYDDPGTAEIAQKIHDREELRLMFEAVKDSSDEELETFYNVLLALKKNERK